MGMPIHCSRRLLLVMMAIIALSATMLPAPVTRAEPAPTPTPNPNPNGPEWPGWALRVTFPKDPVTNLQAPQVIYTAYTYTVTPTVQVTAVITEDISSSCTSAGLSYNGEYAIFDGATSEIVCAVPAWRDLLSQINPGVPGSHPTQTLLTCSGDSPVSGGAKVRLASGKRGNPLIDASELGLALALPVDNGEFRTRLMPHPNNYVSPPRNIVANGNREVIGSDGPTMVALDNYFKWMPYLDPLWKPWFESNIDGLEVGHKDEPSMNTWVGQASDFRLRTTAANVYIGRNVVGSSFFKGEVADALIDPPCKAK